MGTFLRDRWKITVEAATVRNSRMANFTGSFDLVAAYLLLLYKIN